MDMRKLGSARLADLAQGRARGQALARFHPDRTLFQVAILAFPAAAMVDHHAIAAILSCGEGGEIGHPVAHPFHHARRGRQHIDARRHRRAGGQRNIGAVMAVVTQGPAGEIGRLGARIMVGVLLDIAGLAQPAVHRQRQFKGPRRWGEGHQEKGCAPSHSADHSAVSKGGFWPVRRGFCGSS